MKIFLKLIRFVRPENLIFIVALFATNGCSMIPYEKPEDRERIQRDLNIGDVKITGISELNWCSFNYEDVAKCKPIQGLGVLTADGLMLSTYHSGGYRNEINISALDVRCTHENGVGSFYVFTETKAFMLVPITPSGKLHEPMRKKIYDYLNGMGAKKFVGNEISFILETGKREYGASIFIVGAVPVPIPRSSPVHVVVNPCPN